MIVIIQNIFEYSGLSLAFVEKLD